MPSCDGVIVTVDFVSVPVPPGNPPVVAGGGAGSPQSCARERSHCDGIGGREHAAAVPRSRPPVPPQPHDRAHAHGCVDQPPSQGSRRRAGPDGVGHRLGGDLNAIARWPSARTAQPALDTATDPVVRPDCPTGHVPIGGVVGA